MSAKVWHIIQHPLLLPLALIGGVAGADVVRGVWLEVHLPIFVVGVAVVLCVYLISKRDRVWVRTTSDSFDEVRRNHRARIESLETFRELQLEHNRNERRRLTDSTERIEQLEQLPIIHAARQRRT